MYHKSHVSNHRPRPMMDLLISIILPSFILMKFSGDSALGPSGALILALSFPFVWGLQELVRYRKFNFLAILGVVSVLLTGGIGLLKLDPQWLAFKEAAIPALLGLAIFISTLTPYPLIRTMLYNPSILAVDTIHRKLSEKGLVALFETRLRNANYLFGVTFIFSAIMNYLLAKWIVTSPAGSEAFNEELGRLTLLSYPAIAVPSLLMMMGIFYYLWRTLREFTGLSLESVIVTGRA